MANKLTIECADRSVRWYLTPGQTSRYEILVINQTGDERVDCAMSLDDPAEGGSFEPASFSLRPRERKTVALTFTEEAQVPRDQRVLISVRDSEGIIIESFEHGLISAGGIDCTISLAWKEPILDGNEVRGFVVSCAIKSLSASPGQFPLQFTPHPSLEFVDVTPIKLQPGQTETIAVPILWKRTVKDSAGENHPRVVEVGVAVSQGRRSSRLPWETIEARLAELHQTAARAQEAAIPHAPETPVESAHQEPLFEMPDAAASSGASAAHWTQTPFTPAPAPSAPPAPAPPAAGPIVPVAASSAPAVTAPPSETSARNGVVPNAPAPPDVQASAQAAPQAAAAATPAPKAPPADFERPEDDDALMSLLVGKPVSPPAGWRGPGRDAPDAPPDQPPSIYARTPPSVVSPPPKPAPPPKPPSPPQATPPPEPPAIAQPYRRVPAPPAEAASAPQAYRRAPSPPGPATPTEEVDQTAPSEQGADPFAALESSVVGRPPSLAQAVESGREFTAAKARRRVDVIEPERHPSESKLPAFVIGGTALLAALLGAFLLFRPQTTQPTTQPPPQPAATMTVPPPVVLQTPIPAPSQAGAKPGASPQTSSRPGAQPTVAPSAASRIVAQAAQRAVAPVAAASTPRPKPAQVALAPKPVHKPAPKPTHRPIPASRNVVVSLAQGLDAHYGSQGRAVRVVWGAAGQASAHVTLQDDRGSVLSQTDVAGTRQTALLYVPHGYHGSVFVQVISQGALGERTTQSTTLPPFH